MSWETVIGLEIHAQLATRSKIFSGASTAYGAPANSQACAVDLGLPGVLPVLNGAVVRMAVKLGLATDSQIARRSVMARKNYFYPDLPKGYQISQFELPIVYGGAVEIELENGASKRIRITRAHLEEDAGKSLHEDFQGMTGIDLNRAGTPLIEIVSEPDMGSSEEAVAYMRQIHTLVRYLEICDGNMQEGSFRCDANVSVRPAGQQALGTRTEIKNLNSFRFVERAINYEIARQTDLLEEGGVVIQETRLYDPDKDETRSMRGKEEANDYRYFPDPDLLPVVLDDDYIDSVRGELPELPETKRARFRDQYGLSRPIAGLLTQNRDTADYFEAATSRAGGDAILVANWISRDVTGALNRQGLEITNCPVSSEMLGGLLERIRDGTISGKIAQQVFETMWDEKRDADSIIQEQSLEQVTDSGEIEVMVDAVLADNPDQVEQYLAGSEKLLGFFVGQVMKRSQGKANPGQVNQTLRSKLQQRK